MSVLYGFVVFGVLLIVETYLLFSLIPLQLILLIWGFYIIITLLVLAPFGRNYFAKEKLTVNDL